MSYPVLLVEDDRPLREPLAEFLRTEGYEVVTTANGTEALEWLRNHSPPGVILLDLMMPLMSGMQFLTTRRRDFQLRVVPVVVITGWSNRWHEAFTIDVDAVLSKPLDPRLLLAIVSRYCEHRLIA